MIRIIVAFFLLFVSPVYAQQSIGIGPNPPCSAFGTTSGTCLQGAGALGSPSSVGTLPAFTLGGTISGGGNQLNNVVIGTSTPLAGSFTTLGASGVTTITNATAGGLGTGALVLTAGGASIAGVVIVGSGVTLDGANQQISLAGINTFTRNSGTGALTINTNAGNVLLTPNGGTVAITGTITASALPQTSAAQSGTVCYNSGTGAINYDATLGCLASSARFKNIISEVSPAQSLDIVDRLRTVSFTRKVEIFGNNDSAEQFGLTAEQAATVDERLIARDTEGQPLGVRYAEFTAVLAGAVRQLKADNDNLHACQASWRCRIFGNNGQ